MTEAEWLNATDTLQMLRYLWDQPCERKLRLFLAACCRRIQHLLPDGVLEHVVAIAERHADRMATPDEWHAAREWYRQMPEVTPHAAHAVGSLFTERHDLGWAKARDTAEHAQRAVSSDPEEYDAQEAVEQCKLLREILGNPFRPIQLNPAWLVRGDGAAGKLAQQIYNERSFDLMPILADALEEAGCTERELLTHLRGPGPHVVGCWALDVLLGHPQFKELDETAWLSGTNPVPLLNFIHGKTSERKLRLFAVACIRRAAELLESRELASDALRVAEQYADGRASERQREQTWEKERRDRHHWNDFETFCQAAFEADAFTAAWNGISGRINWFSECFEGGIEEGVKELCAVAREIFGNPFRPVRIDPSWLRAKGGTVFRLARQMYARRRFDQMPRLADALEEAGCTDPNILVHCRGSGPHYRGCWLVDLLLGKE